MNIEKPMLAATCENFEALQFPLWASLKLDGIRGLIADNGVYSRSLKMFPNFRLQRQFGDVRLAGLDGEFIAGSVTQANVCHKTQSITNSIDKDISSIVYWVFDYVAKGMAFATRYEKARALVNQFGSEFPIKLVEQRLFHSLDELLEMEETALAAGHEGLMIRRGAAVYKHGRATEKSQDLSKVKRFVSDEAVVIGFEPKYHNGNSAFTNELGRTTRSSHQENLVALDTLGCLILQTEDGVEFGCGTGFDDQMRKEIWSDRKSLKGKLVTFKSFPVGVKDAPRHPVFVSFRTDL